MKNKINRKIIIKNSLVALIPIIVYSFFQPVINNFFNTLGSDYQVTGFYSLLASAVVPLNFLSLVNIMLRRNYKNVIGTLISMPSLVFLTLFYKYSAINSVVLLIISVILPIISIAITRALNTNVDYRYLIAGSIIGFILGIVFVAIFFVLLLAFLNLFIDIKGPGGGYLVGAFGAAFIWLPFGFVFWFSISLAEQIFFIRKQKVA